MELNGVRIPAGYNGIGLHDTPGAGTAIWSYAQSIIHAELLKSRGVTLYKVFSNGANKMERVRAYVDSGIVTIIRPWIHHPWGRGIPVPYIPDLKPYIDVGAQMIELGNEWNISCEWLDDAIPWDPQVIATEVCNWWEECLERAAQIPGMIPLFPSNTPGGNVDHRECYPAIRAELVNRGLLSTLKHVAVHPRPHNNPPWSVWTDRNTVTFDEWRWIRDALQPTAYYWGTEHGYSLNDDQNHELPRIDLAMWTDYSWELQVRMNPAHADAIEPGLAGHMHWFEAGWGSWGVWGKDALRDSNVPEMPAPSPLWVKMGEYPESLRFERYGGEQPPPVEPPPDEPEIVKGIDVSYWQNKGINWQAAWDAGNRFAYIRASSGLSVDSACFGHFDQARYHTPDMQLGLYHYLTTSYDGRRQGRLLAALTYLFGPDLEGAIDVEAAGLTALQVRGCCEAYHAELFRWPRIYTRPSYWNPVFGHDLDDLATLCGLWVAHWDTDKPSLPNGWTDWQVWQTGVKLGPEYPIAIDRNLMKVGAEPPPPEPPPVPPPGGFTVNYQEGGPYIVGDFTRQTILTCYDPWANMEHCNCGSKPEYGPFGFLFSAPEVGTYEITDGFQSWDVETRAGQIAVCSWS